ncbi:MAG: D-alanyl-D-alanine carboxypeptidase family protein [Robiginitomaculum sp.]|nr:D-alanyl-D-alanine carboxypeptidase family protein [Robiginitomaculum sp.]
MLQNERTSMRALISIFILLGLAPMTLAAEFETPATHAVILDYDTGLVLFGHDADTPIPPASMTKIMTLYMVFERLKSGALSLDDEFTVSADAWRRGGFSSGSSTMCLRPKERVRVEDLIRGVIVLSGNDAAITLAENIAGSEAAFARQMTERAHELGLNTVQFHNATGWPDPGHEISVHDLAKLTRMIIRDFPEDYAYFSEREFDWCKAAPSNRYNRNPLLGVVPGADGLKTGHTKESGFGLAGSAVRDGKRRIIVFTGMKSSRGRASEGERLMRAAFGEFDIKTLYEKGAVVGEAKVALGKALTVPVITDQQINVAYFRPNRRSITTAFVYDGPVQAPVQKGDPIGKLVVEEKGEVKASYPLLAGASVEKKGLFGQAIAGLVGLIRGAGTE